MDYEIIRTDRKTVAISIKDGRVILRDPQRLKDKDAEKIIREHEKWISEKLIEQRKRKEKKVELTEAQIIDLKREARAYFESKIASFSKIMNLKYGRITITSANTRFGSCSSKGNLSFSYRLMLYPEAAVDYVVVHELAHLYEMNHSARFYRIVESVLPDYKERKKLLKK
jgi:predicted metal-dependent hydrolase